MHHTMAAAADGRPYLVGGEYGGPGPGAGPPVYLDTVYMLDEEAGTLSLEVEDDGRGIGEDRRAGVGLTSMRERAEELGGFYSIESAPSGGTRIRAFLPFAREDVVEDEAGKQNLKEA